MQDLVVLCCLLFAVHAFADNAYFEGYVTLKAGQQGSEGEGSVCVQGWYRGRYWESFLLQATYR